MVAKGWNANCWQGWHQRLRLLTFGPGDLPKRITSFLWVVFLALFVIPAMFRANEWTLLTLFASSWDSRVPVSFSKDLVKNQRNTLLIISEVSILHKQTNSKPLHFYSSSKLYSFSEMNFHNAKFSQDQTISVYWQQMKRKVRLSQFFSAYEKASILPS